MLRIIKGMIYKLQGALRQKIGSLNFDISIFFSAEILIIFLVPEEIKRKVEVAPDKEFPLLINIKHLKE